jgi:hypothetical protein
MSRTGLCAHCGKPDAPVSPDGYIDRHYRADHVLGRDPGNELCAGSAMGGGHLRPGEPCQHIFASATCRRAA